MLQDVRAQKTGTAETEERVCARRVRVTMRLRDTIRSPEPDTFAVQGTIARFSWLNMNLIYLYLSSFGIRANDAKGKL